MTGVRTLIRPALLASLALHAGALAAAAALWARESRLLSVGVPLVLMVAPREEVALADPPPEPRLLAEEPDLARWVDAPIPEEVPEPLPQERIEDVERPSFVLTAWHLVAVARSEPEESQPALPESASLEEVAAFVPATPLAGACPPPEYPWESIRRGQEGVVRLRLRIGRDGAVLEVSVETSSGFPRLDEAARAAVARWRFVPSTEGGLGVEDEVLLPVRFRLEGAPH